MFKRFVVWLATRFLDDVTLTKLFADTVFRRQGSIALSDVVQAATGSEKAKQFNAYVLDLLSTQFDHSELSYIYALEQIQRYSADPAHKSFQDFLGDVAIANETTNDLKALRAIKGVIHQSTWLHDDTVVKSIAFALRNKHKTNVVSNTK